MSVDYCIQELLIEQCGLCKGAPDGINEIVFTTQGGQVFHNWPDCGSIGTIKRIFWGMPSFEIDISKYVIGVCCIPENPHEIACSKCEWSGQRRSLMPANRVIRGFTQEE